MRTIHYDLQAVEPQATWEAGLGSLDIPAGCVIQAGSTPKRARRSEPVPDIGRHQRLDLEFRLSAQLETLRAEQLDAVVLEWVMRRGDHYAEIRTQAAGQHGDRR